LPALNLRKFWRESCDVTILGDEREQYLRRKIQTIARHLRSELISDFVDEHVQVKQGPEEWQKWQRDALKREISDYLWQHRDEELYRYLSKIAELGLEKANKQSERERRWGGGYLGFVLEGLRGIVFIAIVLFIFGSVESKFQAIACALLIFIYATVQEKFAVQSNAMARIAVASGEQFRRLRFLVKEATNSGYYEAQSDDDLEAVREVNRSTVRFYIMGAVMLVMKGIALWKLVTSIL
jgi:hypothetical protein